MRPYSAIVVVGLLLQAGCLFEPDCTTYEECIEPEPNAGNGSSNNATSPNATSPNATTPDNSGNSGNVITTNNTASGETCNTVDACPPADNYSFGGSRQEPLGCGFSGNLDFFAFGDEAAVCARQPRSYEMWLQACDNPYIVEVSVQVLEICTGDLELNFSLEGFSCDQDNTRCTSTESEALVQFIINSDGFQTQPLKFDVTAGEGSFNYLLNVRSRR